MTSLSVENFSCLHHARFEMSPVTVLIGPQGSGKSVTIKLNYFFLDLLVRQYACAEKGMDFEELKRDTARNFRTWFPPAAWGNHRFNINFSAGAFSVRVLRRTSKGGVVDDVAVTFSDFFTQSYRELLRDFESVKANATVQDPNVFRFSFDPSFKVRERSEARLSEALGADFIALQTFIPAGRAFFTCIGRLVAAIEQGSSLDPATIRFAKLFASLRDVAPRRSAFNRDENRDAIQARRKVMRKLFGGEIKFENDLEYVETPDGRKVPFAALSSGQQELIPMWVLMDYFADQSFGTRNGKEVFYVEEPEAHLFPEAQSELMDFLIGMAAPSRDRRNLVLTTHSPYILSKLNNYLKAGSLGRQRRLAAQVASFTARRS